MIIDIVQFSCSKPEMSDVLQGVLGKVIKLMERKLFRLDRDFAKTAGSHLLTVISQHGKGMQCKSCSLPGNLGRRGKLALENAVERSSPYNWPENKNFVFSPFLAKTNDFILFCLPTGRLWFSKHVIADSKIIYRTKKGTLSLSLSFSLSLTNKIMHYVIVIFCWIIY